jgi:hypothetical protein
MCPGYFTPTLNYIYDESCDVKQTPDEGHRWKAICGDNFANDAGEYIGLTNNWG